MIGAGTQELFGWFGGGGIEETTTAFREDRPAAGARDGDRRGISEVGSGALLAAGFETPFAAAFVTGTMLTAVERLHRAKDPWVQNGGWEYPGVLIALILALVETGPGKRSLDSALGLRRKGPAWAALAFGAGALAAYAIDELAHHNAPAPADPRMAVAGAQAVAA